MVMQPVVAINNGMPMQPPVQAQAVQMNPVYAADSPQPGAPPGAVYMKNGVWLDADGAEVKA